MIRAFSLALGLSLLLPSTRAEAQVSSEPNVDFPGVVDVGWRTIVDPMGRQTRQPYFYLASPDDIRRAQQVLTVDRDYLRAETAADVATADRILNPTFIGLDEEGHAASKSDTLARLRRVASDAVDMNRATLRFSDKIAVISGEQTRGAMREAVLFARVYLETKPGVWELVSSTRFRTR